MSVKEMGIFRGYIIEELKNSAKKLGVPADTLESLEFNVEPPTKSDLDADYTSNIAFKLARHLKKNPKLIAEELRETLSENLNFSQVQVGGNGFLNFKLSRGGELVERVIKDALFGKLRIAEPNPRKVLFEFVSANPTGPLNVVNGRAATIGDILANVFQRAGHQVSREYYVNDLGGQIEKLADSVLARLKQLLGEDVPLPEGGYPGEYLIDIAKKFMETHSGDLKLPDEVLREKLLKFTIDEIVSWQRRSLERFGVRYDTWFRQSQLTGELKKVMRILEEKGLLYQEDGAIVFKTTVYGDDKDRVVRKRDGTWTYFAYDIAYISNKYSRGFQYLLTILGPDHHGYIKRLLAATKALGYDPETHEILLHQLVTLTYGGKEVRMSKRQGKFVTLDELLDSVDRDVARYFFITRLKDTHLEFDVELALRASMDNPVYYVKYSHARICSVFRKGNLTDEEVESLASSLNLRELLEEREFEVIKAIDEAYSSLRSAYLLREPYYLTLWAYNAAYAFHKFYDTCKIIGSKRQDIRLVISLAFKRRLSDWASIVGVSLPEEM